MSIWKISRASHAQSVSLDSLTIDVPAGRTLRVLAAKAIGMASAAASGAELGVFRVTTVGSGGSPTSYTLKNIDPNGVSAPSGFTAKSGYSTQPTIESDPMIRLAIQPLGGQDRESPIPGAEVVFWSASAYQVSVRGISGTPNVVLELTLELS